jgi:hypothetical protein
MLVVVAVIIGIAYATVFGVIMYSSRLAGSIVLLMMAAAMFAIVVDLINIGAHGTNVALAVLPVLVIGGVLRQVNKRWFIAASVVNAVVAAAVYYTVVLIIT